MPLTKSTLLRIASSAFWIKFVSLRNGPLVSFFSASAALAVTSSSFILQRLRRVSMSPASTFPSASFLGAFPTISCTMLSKSSEPSSGSSSMNFPRTACHSIAILGAPEPVAFFAQNDAPEPKITTRFVEWIDWRRVSVTRDRAPVVCLEEASVGSASLSSQANHPSFLTKSRRYFASPVFPVQ
ncbi:hypothetical protein D3C87_1319660 [compost metagenome]